MKRLFGFLSLPALLLALATAFGSIVQTQEMPNPRQMSGVPLPVGDVPPGTVTVRVIRGSFANPVTSQTVEITGAGTSMRSTTNEIGRAEFKGLTPGTRVKASAVVAGERIESQEFAVPATGGIRLILVAADGAAAPGSAAAPPPSVPVQPGTVVLSDESRFVFEMGEDGLSVFYILQVQNPSTAPVQPSAPIVFDLPSDARGAALLQGSSPQASVRGRQVHIAGPFAPGSTLVQIAYTMPIRESDVSIEQRLPLTLMHVAVVVQKIGDMRLASPQIAEQRDMAAQGNVYIAGRGGVVQAGDTLRFNFSGMPHHATWPRDVAVVLGVLVLAGGAWSSFHAGRVQDAQGTERRRLEERRDRLFDELTTLEVRHREQAIDPDRYADRRRELISALERVYVALDDETAVSRAS